MKQLSRPHKALLRSRKNRKIAGVCGGLANYFNIDSIWVRLLFILFFFLGGSACLVYIILWILMPLEPIDYPNKFPHYKN